MAVAVALIAQQHADHSHWSLDCKCGLAHWKAHARYEDQDDRGFDHRDHHARDCFFQPRDARIVTQYYAPRSRELPPGLQKKLYRNGHLPPGWERRMQPLPVGVERQLVPL